MFERAEGDYTNADGVQRVMDSLEWMEVSDTHIEHILALFIPGA